MKDGMDAPATRKFFQKDIETVETLSKVPVKIRYFDVDLNGDGLQDKVVIIRSPLHSGSAGDAFRILINNGDSYANSNYMTLRLYHGDSVDLIIPGASVRILKSKNNGFHTFKINSRSVEFFLVYENGRYRYKETLQQ